MRKKNIYKIINILLIMILLISISNVVEASSLSSMVNPNNGAASPLNKPVNVVIGIFQVVAVGVGVIMIVALAIKYMSAAPGDRAEIKKHAVVYIVGAVMAFSASGLMQLLKAFTQEALG